MKDAFGKTIAIDDRVIFIDNISGSSPQLQEGSVIGFSKTKVRIKFKYRGDTSACEMLRLPRIVHVL